MGTTYEGINIWESLISRPMIFGHLGLAGGSLVGKARKRWSCDETWGAWFLPYFCQCFSNAILISLLLFIFLSFCFLSCCCHWCCCCCGCSFFTVLICPSWSSNHSVSMSFGASVVSALQDHHENIPTYWCSPQRRSWQWQYRHDLPVAAHGTPSSILLLHPVRSKCRKPWDQITLSKVVSFSYSRAIAQRWPKVTADWHHESAFASDLWSWKVSACISAGWFLRSWLNIPLNQPFLTREIWLHSSIVVTKHYD